MTASIPSSSDKTSLENLKNIQTFGYEGGVRHPEQSSRFTLDEAGFRFDFLWRPNPGTDRLFILFAGDAVRDKNDPPVFQRWSWSSFFPGHCLYVSDPSLFLASDMGLAWYAGTASFDPLPTIARVATEICAQLSIPLSNVFSYGSSGGGYAALRLATIMPQIGAVAINPQTDIMQYWASHVDRYLAVCFGTTDRESILRQHATRLNLLTQAEALRDRRIIYMQNTVDTHHYKKHYLPFCKALGSGTGHQDSAGPMYRLLFSHEGGHGKAETPEIFAKAMELIAGYAAAQDCSTQQVPAAAALA